MDNRIRDLRSEQKLTLKEVSAKTYIAISTLNSYEKNYRVPKIENLMRLSDFFNVPIAYLQGRGLSKRSFLDFFASSFYFDESFREKVLKKLGLEQDYLKKLGNAIIAVQHKIKNEDIHNKIETENKLLRSIKEYLIYNVPLCSDYLFLSSIQKKDILLKECYDEKLSDKEMNTIDFEIDEVDSQKYEKFILDNVKKKSELLTKKELYTYVLNDYMDILKVKDLYTNEIDKTIKDVLKLFNSIDVNYSDNVDNETIKEISFKNIGMLEDYKDLTNKNK